MWYLCVFSSTKFCQAVQTRSILPTTVTSLPILHNPPVRIQLSLQYLHRILQSSVLEKKADDGGVAIFDSVVKRGVVLVSCCVHQGPVLKKHLHHIHVPMVTSFMLHGLKKIKWPHIILDAKAKSIPVLAVLLKAAITDCCQNCTIFSGKVW